MLRHCVFFGVSNDTSCYNTCKFSAFHTYVMLCHWTFSCTGRHWKKMTTGKKSPYFPHWKQIRHWKKKIRICTLIFLQLKSLICTTCAGFWNLIMQLAWYLKRFGLESHVRTVLAASWSQHLYYAGDYLQHFVLSATYCLGLVLGSIQVG